jgi:hypothetical protein
MSTPAVTPDTEALFNLSEDDFLKQYREAQAAPVVETTTTEEQPQPRDENGRFVAKTEPAPVETKTEPEPQAVDDVVYRREIDLGDGAGKEVFEAASLEELVDKIADAKGHASRKIRELSAAQKTVQEKAQTVIDNSTTLSDEEKFIFGNELLTDPLAAINKLMAKATGKNLNEMKTALSRLETIEAERQEVSAAKQFLASHPDLTLSQADGDRIERYVKTYKLPPTAESIEQAYRELSEGGLLELKRPETNNSDTTPTTRTAQRIAAPATKTVVVQRRAASGLSTRQAETKPQELTEQDLYNMSDADFYKLDPRGRAFNTGW